MLSTKCVYLSYTEGCPCGVMVKVMDCGIVISKDRTPVALLRSLSANTLGKGMNPLILPAMG